jgi:hypothetical protein
MKLLWIGIAGPALVTTWLGGATASGINQPDGKHSWLPSLTTSAWAEDASAQGKDDSFWRGAKIVFGVGKDESRYRVIVGSYKSKAEATSMLEKAKKVAPDLNVFIGEPQPNNEYFPVVASGYLPYPAAKKIKDDVSEALSVKDVYLSPYQYR